MAKVITTELQHSGASGANVTLDSSKNVTCENNLQVDGNVTVTGTLPADKLTGALPAISGASLTGISSQDTLSFRNMIQNGQMQIHQRYDSVTGAAQGYNTADRWFLQKDTGTINQTIENDGPTGFAKSLKNLFTDANSPSSGNGRTTLTYKVEARDTQRIGYGTAGCLQTTLSFWVKSNVTGTYVVRLYRPDSQRLVSGSYTISASATWEKKSITFPADTTGTVPNDSGEGLRFEWGLIVGATENTGSLATTWDTWDNNDQSSLTGNVNVGASANNYWQITGVQLETGTTATDFEHRSYQDDWMNCQRYFKRMYNRSIVGPDGTAWARCKGLEFWVPMRANPTVVFASGTIDITNGSATGTSTSMNAWYGSADHQEYDLAIATGSFSTGDCLASYSNNAAFTFTADL